MSYIFDWDKFNELPVVGILRGYSSEQVRNIVEYSTLGGLRNIEITVNSEGFADLIRLAIDTAAGRMNVGAGTVCTIADLDCAIAAGASYIVTPIVNPEVIFTCRERGIPVIAGAFTPTEVYTAWSQGADMVKVFPINHFGPGYIKDLLGPLDKIPLVPTGGVSLANMVEYLKAGARGFGVGSPLFDKKRVEAKDWTWVKEQAGLFAESYLTYRSASNNCKSSSVR